MEPHSIETSTPIKNFTGLAPEQNLPGLLEKESQSIATQNEIVPSGNPSLRKGAIDSSKLLTNSQAKTLLLSEKTLSIMVTGVKLRKGITYLKTTLNSLKEGIRSLPQKMHEESQAISYRLGITSSREILINSQGVSTFSRMNKVEAEFTKFKEFFTKSLILKMSKEFFPMYSKRERDKALYEKQEKISKNVNQLKEKKADLEKEIANLKEGDEKLIPLQEKKTHLEGQIEALEMHLTSTNEIEKGLEEIKEELDESKQEIRELYADGIMLAATLEQYSRSTKDRSEQIKTIEGKLREIENTLNVLEQKTGELEDKRKELLDLQEKREKLPPDLRKKIDFERERVLKFQHYTESGEKKRENLARIGGERLALETKDGVKLDGFFLDASTFRSKLKDAGGEFITFSGQDNSTLKGIVFDLQEVDTNKEHILNSLVDFGAFGMDSSWTLVQYTPPEGSKKVVLVPTSSLPGNEDDQGWIRKDTSSDNYTIIANKSQTPPKREEIDTQSQGGTVILSSGSHGVYEVMGDEAAAFLFQGMNVVLFNYRGHNLSEGLPSDKNCYEDIETVYQFAKKRTEQQDNQILFKGLCFGGGPSSYAAGKHPESNLFLDQTFSSFKNIVEKAASQEIEKIERRAANKNSMGFEDKAKQWVGKSIVSIVAKCAVLIAPDFNVAKNLEKNRGEKALLYVHDDQMIPLREVEENMKAAYKGGGSVKVIASTGEHGDRWMSLEDSGEKTFGKIQEQAEKKIKKIKEEYNLLRRQGFEERNELNNKYLDLNETAYPDKSPEDVEKESQELVTRMNEVEDKIKKIDLEKKQKIDKVYSEIGISKEELEERSDGGTYHSRNQVLQFLEKAHLNDPLL